MVTLTKRVATLTEGGYFDRGWLPCKEGGYLDKEGGYLDKEGGYLNKEGGYLDKDGGYLDRGWLP